MPGMDYTFATTKFPDGTAVAAFSLESKHSVAAVAQAGQIAFSGLRPLERYVARGWVNGKVTDDLFTVPDIAETRLDSVESGVVGIFPAAIYASIQAAIDAANAAGGGVVLLSPGAHAVSTGLAMKSRVILAGPEGEWSVWAHDTTPEDYQLAWLEADGTAGSVITFGTTVVDAGVRNLLINANGRRAIDLVSSATRGGNRLRNVYASGGDVYVGQKETRIRDLLVMHAVTDGLTIDAQDCSLSGDILAGYNGARGVVFTANSGPVRCMGSIDSFFNTTIGLELNAAGHRLSNVQVDNNGREGVLFKDCTSSKIGLLYASLNGREFLTTGTTRYADVKFAHSTAGNQGCGILGGTFVGDGVQSSAIINAETVVSFPLLLDVRVTGTYNAGSAITNLISGLVSFTVLGGETPSVLTQHLGFPSIMFRSSSTTTDTLRWTDGSGNTRGGVTGNGAFFQKQSAQALAANGAVTIDASTTNSHIVTLQANATSSSITNAKAGQTLRIAWLQDGTGSRTYAWPSDCKFAAGTAPTATTTANRRDCVTFEYDGTNWIEQSRSVGVG